MSKPILCIDFDGVIHSYTSSWKGADVISDPIVPGFFDWAEVADEYFDLVIYSSRSKTLSGIAAMRKWFIEQFVEYCRSRRLEAFTDADAEDTLKIKAEGFPVIHLRFAHEKPPAFLTIDDRAIQFDGSWENPHLNPERMSHFKPWNKQ
jgi:hypothetical protein